MGAARHFRYSVSHMWRLSLVVLMGGVASAKEGPAVSTESVMKELRRVESAALTGEFDDLRMQYSAKAKASASDPMPRVFLAWLTLPSDDSWNQLKSVAQIFPDNTWAHYGMGRIYASWKMREQALAELNPLVRRDPSFYPALIVLADLAVARGEIAEAEGLYRRALAVADEPLARTGLGVLLLKQGKKDEAAEELKRSTAVWPQQPAALQALLPLLAEMKDPGLIDTAAAVVALRPRDIDARRKLGDVRLAAGDQAGAIKDYEQVVKMNGADAALYTRLADLYHEATNLAAEERMLTLLSALDASNSAPLLRLANLKLSQKDLPAAEVRFKDVLARDPVNVEARLNLARMKLAAGLPHLALEQFRAVQSTDPSNEESANEVKRIEGEFKLPGRRLKGNVNGIYWAVGASLEKLYNERKAAKPALAGAFKLKVRVAAKGVADSVELVEDSLQDPVLLGHAWFSMKDAEYWDKKQLEAVIEFSLGKKKK